MARYAKQEHLNNAGFAIQCRLVKISRLSQKSFCIADLFRDLDFVVLNEIPAQGRNDIPILI